eukprot:Gb_07835 [translate_table: standard]
MVSDLLITVDNQRLCAISPFSTSFSTTGNFSTDDLRASYDSVAIPVIQMASSSTATAQPNNVLRWLLSALIESHRVFSNRWCPPHFSHGKSLTFNSLLFHGYSVCRVFSLPWFGMAFLPPTQ